MIRSLHIRNLAIISEATLDLGPGLNLLTGETGAGKSIVVDALAMALGGRAGPDLIRAGCDRASVEIDFEVGGEGDAAAFLEEHGYPVEDRTIVARREITTSGRGRAFLGGVMAPLADLKALASRILDLHAQHQHRSLTSPANHAGLLDRQAELERELDEMAAASRELDAASGRLITLRDGAQRVAQRVDMLRFQIAEIDAAAVQPGERQALRAERDLLRGAETILHLCRSAYDALYEGDAPALARLSEALRALHELGRFDPRLREEAERGEALRLELEELAYLVRDYPSRLNTDPHRLEAIEERLVLLETLLRKYAAEAGEEGILERRRAAAEELAQLTDGTESVAELEARVERLRDRAVGVAADLSRKRRAAAAALERKVEEELAELGMKGARFAVDFRLCPAPGSGLWVEGEEVSVDAAGCDVVEFLLGANRGEALRPLAAVASGGELSRIMLALEGVFQRRAGSRTLVFDEVDDGIGGAVAEAVARRLRALSRTHQVICVTHLPQIASYADCHIAVRKTIVGGRTEVKLEDLDGAGRVRELARMLAGERVTDTALRHAAELRARATAP